MAEPLTGTLIVSVLRGRDLINKDISITGKDVSDPFCKFTALNKDGKQLAKWSTKVIDNNLNPVWNEQFSVPIDEPTPSVLLKFEVLDEDLGGSTDSLGVFEVEVKPSHRFDQEETHTLLPPKKGEKVKGDATIHIAYRKGEKVKVNAEAEKRMANKSIFKNMSVESKDAIKELRMKKDVFTECEEAKMALLIGAYKQYHAGAESPVFQIIHDSVPIVNYKYQKPAYQVDEKSLVKDTWFRQMEKSDGAFKVASQRIIEDIIAFQLDKKSRGMRDGYLNDPESLFCEEIKKWCAEILCTWEKTKTARDKITERIQYLEYCLLLPSLFDKPSQLSEHTIQRVMVNARRILKYQVLAEIEKELATEDAGRAFEDLRKHCVKLIYNAYQFLAHVFRAEVENQLTAADKLLKTLEEDEQLSKVMGDELTKVMDSIQGVKSRNEKYTFDLGQRGLKSVLDFLDLTKLSDNDPNLPFIFTGTLSGIEEFFRGNSFITFKYLKAHALLLELGRLFVVIEKAANCAKQGGTLLVYGVANAQLNALLDSTKSMINAIRDEFTAVCKIAECAFEKLVYENKATVERSKWMKHFQHVFPASNMINESVKEVLKDVADIKATANAMTLYERFQKAQNDTADFLSSAEGFSQRTAAVLGQEYKKPEITEESLKKGSIDNTEALFQQINQSVNK
jgi:hypothetical protein